MPANYVLLEKITVGAASAASVSFTSIPQTGYTDLVIKGSARSLRASDEDGIGFGINGSGATDWVLLSGNGSLASSGTLSSLGFGSAAVGRIPGANATANTFGNFELYLPNYTSSNVKSYSADSATENNSSTAYLSMLAAYQSNTAAVTSIILLAGNANLAPNSTFYLYGVAKLGTTPAIAPKAAGGDIVMTDGTYWYHAFRSSGTFTPSLALSCDVLTIAGGGSGGSGQSGGGGAGGVFYAASNSVTATNYTVTVGAGAAGGGGSARGLNGSNSQFGSLTAAVGGGGGGNYDFNATGLAGGSGGGAGCGPTPPYSGGAATSGQGNAGGNVSSYVQSYRGGGGGGAGAAGSTGPVSGNGGVGTSAYSSWGSATGTGQNVSGTYYFAGGGGGAGEHASDLGTGGYGGGASGGNGTPASATANTGGGGGGTIYDNRQTGGSGGSGIVIIRYAV